MTRGGGLACEGSALGGKEARFCSGGFQRGGGWEGPPGLCRAVLSVSDHRAKSVAGQWTAGPLEGWEAGQLDVVSTMVFHWLCDSGHFTPSSRDEEADGRGFSRGRRLPACWRCHDTLPPFASRHLTCKWDYRPSHKVPGAHPVGAQTKQRRLALHGPGGGGLSSPGPWSSGRIPEGQEAAAQFAPGPG